MKPTIDPLETHISVSRQADSVIDRLGICRPEDNFRVRRRCVVDAAFVGFEPIEELQETHFLARATLASRPVVLLCMTFAGSPRGDKKQSAIIRGVFTPERAAELTALRKGLAPFVNETYGRTAGKNQTNDCDTLTN